MNTQNLFSTFNKAVLLISFSILSVSGAFAQTTAQKLEGPALEKEIYLNKKNGLSPYQGITQQYFITCNDQDIISKYSTQVISDIKRITDVIDCNIDIQNKMIIVKFPAENAKENRELNLEKIKATIAGYNIKFISYSEGTYRN
jgi:hypothetical protein